jgi:ATP-binding cassette subfamily C protein
MTVVNADLQSDANELVQGAKFVKATGTEQRAVTRLSRIIGELRHLTFSNGFDVQIVRAIFEYASAVIVIALLVMGPTVLNTDVGTVVVVVAMFVRLFPKVTGLRQCQQSISLVLPAFDAVSDMVRSATLVAESKPVQTVSPLERTGPVAIDVDHLAVMIGERQVLNDVSLRITEGEFVALVGPTGAGKTTLVDCILGLRRFSSGSIAIDHEPLSSLSLSHWRASVGYLGQDPLLFHATIAENLRWVRPEASDDDVKQALSLASADFVYRLPHGLNTIVGDAGGRLSGGERQRVALARALLGAPRLLVLDEATSALDSETEQSVVATLAGLKGKVTIVAITHRPALLDAADRILSVRDGLIFSESSEGLRLIEEERRQ